MNKIKQILPVFLVIVFFGSIFVVGLRYNMYPYLFCGRNSDERVKERVYTSENIEDGEGYAVMLEVRLDRFSRYQNGALYQGENSRAIGMWDFYLTDKGAAEYSMRNSQLDGSYIAETGTLAEQFPYVVLQRDYQIRHEEEKRHIYQIYVDLGHCYLYQYTQDADILKELRNTSSASVYISEGDAEFTEDEKIVLWK